MAKKANKNQNNAKVRPIPGTSQNGIKSAERTQRTIVRTVWNINGSQQELLLQQATTQANVFGPPGDTKYANASLSWDLADFYPLSSSQFIKTVDQFRFEHIDIYMQISNCSFNAKFRRFNVWYKPDFDDNDVISWADLQDRDGVEFKMLNPLTNTMMVKLCSIKPSAFFESSGASSSPSNMIVKDNTYFDTKSAAQRFVGLNVHVEANSDISEAWTPAVELLYRARTKFLGAI
jgi:hypothetical protein